MAQTFTSTEVTTGTNVFGDNQSQRVNENTLRSNFSGSSQPSDPVVGQHWYDTGNNREMTYNGTSWVAVDTNTATQVDVKNSAGNLSNLKSFLSVAHNDDGTLKVTPTSSIDEFKENALAVTYVNPTTFTTPNDLTGIFTQYRKVKVYLSASTAISSVSSSSYDGTSNVTTVVLSTGAMDATLVSIRYSIVQYGERQDTVHTADLAPYVAMIYNNAGAHNAIYRGKDITDYWTSGGMYAAIAAGTFAGIYPGDYIRVPITVNGSTTTYDIVIGDCDYHLHRGDTETTTHHVLAFTRMHIGNEHMNATNTTAGGYIGSDMWKTILPKYTTAIKNAFGSSHILTHRELLSNAESDTIASAAGAGWSGGTTGWGWYDVDVNLFNEPMVYGCRPFSSSGFDIGDCDTQVAAMRHDKSLSFTRTYWCWLRAVVSSSYFAVAGGGGYAGYGDASRGDGGVRVYFLLK